MTELQNEIKNNSLPVLSLIRSKLRIMTPTQKRIADFIIKNPAQAVRMSISELASEVGLKSESNIVRFYRILGFSGYHNFKVTLATEIGGSSFYHTYEDILVSDDIDTIKQKIFKGSIQTLHENINMVSDSNLQKAVDLIDSAERLFFIGYASSGSIAMEGFFKFSRLKSHCYYSPDSHINAALLSEPLAGDVIFCISESGETKDVIIPAEHAKPIAKIIALTGSADSPLAKIADVCITSYSEEVNYQTEVIVSRIVQLAIITVLFMACSLKKGPQVFEKLKRSRQAISYLKF